VENFSPNLWIILWKTSQAFSNQKLKIELNLIKSNSTCAKLSKSYAKKISNKKNTFESIFPIGGKCPAYNQSEMKSVRWKMIWSRVFKKRRKSVGRS